MKISKRLYAISEAVELGSTIADIGTDHGYVPILLCRENKTEKVIMSDISDASLQKAISSFNEEGIMTDGDCFRVGDGLDPIHYSEVDTIIIAGLGATTIIDILNKDINKTRSFKKFILQPRKHSGSLRYWLYVNGFDIEKDFLIIEGKFSCDIIIAKPSPCSTRKAPYREDDIRWAYPIEFASCDKKALANRVEWKLSAIDEEIYRLQQATTNYDERINKLKADKEYLLDLIAKNEKA